MLRFFRTPVGHFGANFVFDLEIGFKMSLNISLTSWQNWSTLLIQKMTGLTYGSNNVEAYIINNKAQNFYFGLIRTFSTNNSVEC